MNTKGSFEFGVSFLVKIILGIVMLGLGVLLFTTIFNKAETYELEVSDQIRAELLQTMRTGQPVVVLDQTITTDTKHAAVFSLGINNKYAEAKSFSISVSPDSHFDIRMLEPPAPLEPQKDYYTNIVIQPRKDDSPPRAQYSFIVTVTCNDCLAGQQDYGKKQLLVTIH